MDPPGPTHDIPYSVVVRGASHDAPVITPRVIGKWDPDHPPKPVQTVTFLANQEIATTVPGTIVVGNTEKLNVGAPGAGVGVGDGLGLAVGEAVGLADGEALGLALGDAVGVAVGLAEGLAVGEGLGVAGITKSVSDSVADPNGTHWLVRPALSIERACQWRGPGASPDTSTHVTPSRSGIAIEHGPDKVGIPSKGVPTGRTPTWSCAWTPSDASSTLIAPNDMLPVIVLTTWVKLCGGNGVGPGTGVPVGVGVGDGLGDGVEGQKVTGMPLTPPPEPPVPDTPERLPETQGSGAPGVHPIPPSISNPKINERNRNLIILISFL